MCSIPTDTLSALTTDLVDFVLRNEGEEEQAISAARRQMSNTRRTSPDTAATLRAANSIAFSCNYHMQLMENKTASRWYYYFKKMVRINN